MVLCEIIAKVVLSWFPKHIEVTLVDAVPNPIKAHVHGAQFLLVDSVIENAIGHLVVCLDSGCRLGMSHLLEDNPNDCCKFGVLI